MKNTAMPRKRKNPDGKVRPWVALTDEENRLIEIRRAELGMEKSEFMRRAALYAVQNKIDLNKVK